MVHDEMFNQRGGWLIITEYTVVALIDQLGGDGLGLVFDHLSLGDLGVVPAQKVHGGCG